MKTNNILAILTIFILFLGCHSATSTPDDKLLDKKEFQIPKEFLKAKEKVYSSQVDFEEMSARLTFNIITLEKDSANAVLKEISVKLDKGVNNVEFVAKINDKQINTGTKHTFYTYSLVTITYFTTDQTRKISRAKTYTITSNGEIK
ncbi:hypothetical protein HCX49_19690 [Sphingobacterium kitahiroshimense]|uniref:hypothetical protein n=1 Tax=Sphingobacterium sp. B16(2022) TaxID=2914044 RepID=UPI0014390D13|nr:hypothetical protein [Sphingobacterium sp. B16(2022)]NJI75433.1 hypothetical protein [Sphingobacterium sp. B16(2022)]